MEGSKKNLIFDEVSEMVSHILELNETKPKEGILKHYSASALIIMEWANAAWMIRNYIDVISEENIHEMMNNSFMIIGNKLRAMHKEGLWDRTDDHIIDARLMPSVEDYRITDEHIAFVVNMFPSVFAEVVAPDME